MENQNTANNIAAIKSLLACKRPNQSLVGKRVSCARADIARMSRFSDQSTGHVHEHTQSIVCLWQSQLDEIIRVVQPDGRIK
jgi:hypothetical protein